MSCAASVDALARAQASAECASMRRAQFLKRNANHALIRTHCIDCGDANDRRKHPKTLDWTLASLRLSCCESLSEVRCLRASLHRLLCILRFSPFARPRGAHPDRAARRRPVDVVMLSDLHFDPFLRSRKDLPNCAVLPLRSGQRFSQSPTPPRASAPSASCRVHAAFAARIRHGRLCSRLFARRSSSNLRRCSSLSAAICWRMDSFASFRRLDPSATAGRDLCIRGEDRRVSSRSNFIRLIRLCRSTSRSATTTPAAATILRRPIAHFSSLQRISFAANIHDPDDARVARCELSRGSATTA